MWHEDSVKFDGFFNVFFKNQRFQDVSVRTQKQEMLPLKRGWGAAHSFNSPPPNGRGEFSRLLASERQVAFLASQ